MEHVDKDTARRPGRRPAGRRKFGPTALAAALAGITDTAFRKRGFAETSIITDWPTIVGETLAAETAPQKLVFARGGTTGGVLHVRVNGAFAIELQHLMPLVIERINGYFGFAAVARIAMTQGPVAPNRRRRRGGDPPAALTEADEARLRGWLSGIEDDDLRNALAGLGRAVLGGGGPAAR